MDRLRIQRPYQSVSTSENFSTSLSRPDEVETKLVYTETAAEPYDSEDQISKISPNVPPKPWYSGWRVGTFLSALIVLVSLIFNSVVAGWLTKHASFRGGLAELYRGDCSKVKRMDTLVHLVINIVSTMMLSGSNYTMQVLVGPTRKEIDQAHGTGKWLDIGVPSVRNLGKIARLRMWLWLLLGISSIPLHLMFNSAFYSSITTNDYNIVVVNQTFLQGANFSLPNDPMWDDYGSRASFTALQQDAKTFERLSNLDCINAYARDIFQDRRNLIIVSSGLANMSSLTVHTTYGDWVGNSTDASIYYATHFSFNESINDKSDGYDPYTWLCSEPFVAEHRYLADRSRIRQGVSCLPYLDYLRQRASIWAPFGYAAEYCLSEVIPTRCSFNANKPIILTVVAVNVIKVVVMLGVVFFLRSDRILVVGDAIESFLNHPDGTTQGICLLSKSDVEKVTANVSYGCPPPNANKPWNIRLRKIRDTRIVAKSNQRRWGEASSARRRWIALTILSLCLSLIVVFFSLAMKALYNRSWSNIKSIGLGSISPEAMIRGPGWVPSSIHSPQAQVLVSILIANIPQAILSLVYVTINGLLSVMFMANEWSDFAKDRKTLRVSTPKGLQRSTYFLQLPYKIAIPLMIVSTLLHWLVSRSIFLAVISRWGADGKLISIAQVATCGFSPAPMVAVLVVGVTILVALVLIGRRRYNEYIPLVASCSVAISASCHVPLWEEKSALSPLMWGVVRQESAGALGVVMGDDEDGRVGHCSFSSGKVETPVEGKLYAGLKFE